MGLSRSESGKIGNKNSQKTHQANKNKRIEEYLKRGKTCFACKIVMPYEKCHDTYCSRKCAVTLNNRGLNRNPIILRAKCVCCDNFVKFYKHKTCSLECMNNYYWQQMEHQANIISTISSITIRKMLIRNNRQCTKCLNTHWNGELIPIELDHIDGNFKNNLRSNVRLLCPNCHAQTPTYKVKNKGSGRPGRGKN